MASIGAKIRWKEGKILHPASYWRSPSRRRLPRLLIEDRANEVGILVYIQDLWIVFEETNQEAGKIELEDGVALEVYKLRYHLLPAKFKRQDTYEWIKKAGNALLVWGKDYKYFVKGAKRV